MWPYAGVAIAAVLIGAQVGLNARAGREFGFGFFREAPVFAGLLWLIFNGFELQMSAIMTRSGAQLRMDLMVLVPILYVLTAFAVFSIVAQIRASAGPPGPGKGKGETRPPTRRTVSGPPAAARS